MSLLSDFLNLFAQLKVIEQFNVVNRLLPEVTALLISQRVVGVVNSSSVVLFYYLVDFCVGEWFGFFWEFRLHSKLIELFNNVRQSDTLLQLLLMLLLRVHSLLQ